MESIVRLMEKKIDEYCASRCESGCKTCPIYEYEGGRVGCVFESEFKIKRNYDRLLDLGLVSDIYKDLESEPQTISRDYLLSCIADFVKDPVPVNPEFDKGFDSALNLIRIVIEHAPKADE